MRCQNTHIMDTDDNHEEGKSWVIHSICPAWSSCWISLHEFCSWLCCFLLFFLLFSCHFLSHPSPQNWHKLMWFLWCHTVTKQSTQDLVTHSLIWDNMKHHQHSSCIVFSTRSLHSMGRMKMSCSRPSWSTMCPTLSHCPKKLSPSAKGWVDTMWQAFFRDCFPQALTIKNKACQLALCLLTFSLKPFFLHKRATSV